MKSRLPLLLISVSALTACASVPDPIPGMAPNPTAADNHRIQVTQTSQRMEVPVAAGDVALSNEARAELRTFASYLRYGHGALVLSTPSGAGNSDSASILANETRMSLVESGVSYAAVAGSSYDASGDAAAPIVVSFARFEAEAPQCAPLWEQDLAHQSNNQPWESFGCATVSNIAAMVEDPADLLRPRDEDPRDSARRTTVMDAYRAGEQTHATRTGDERVSISNAVQ